MYIGLHKPTCTSKAALRSLVSQVQVERRIHCATCNISSRHRGLLYLSSHLHCITPSSDDACSEPIICGGIHQTGRGLPLFHSCCSRYCRYMFFHTKARDRHFIYHRYVFHAYKSCQIIVIHVVSIQAYATLLNKNVTKNKCENTCIASKRDQCTLQ